MNKVWIGILVGLSLVSSAYSVDSTLIGYWKIDINSSTQIDSSEYGNDGTVKGAVFTSSGKYNGAYIFDGSGDYINMTSMIGLTNSSYSVSGWVKAGSQSVAKTLFSMGNYTVKPLGVY